MNRINYIDISKGIGIFLVVLGHCINMYSGIGNWIYSFHMPLFFFISGYVFNKNTNKDFVPYLKKRLRQLIFPYYKFALIILILNSLIYSYSDFITNFISGSISFLKSGSLGALWFLPVLFFGEILFYLLSYIKTKTLKILIFIVISVLPFILSQYAVMHLYSAYIIFASVIYLGLGHITKKYIEISINKIKSSVLVLFFFSLILISVLFSIIIHRQINQIDFSFISYFSYYFAGFIGIFMILFLSIIIDRIASKYLINILLFLGKNTLIILSIHMFFIGLSVKFIKPFILNELHYKVCEQIFIWIFVVSSIYIINNYFPILIGKGKLNKS